jgi:hypothetical protein
LNQRPLGYEPNELPDCSTPLPLMISGPLEGQTGRPDWPDRPAGPGRPVSWTELGYRGEAGL